MTAHGERGWRLPLSVGFFLITQYNFRHVLLYRASYARSLGTSGSSRGHSASLGPPPGCARGVSVFVVLQLPHFRYICVELCSRVTTDAPRRPSTLHRTLRLPPARVGVLCVCTNQRLFLFGGCGRPGGFTGGLVYFVRAVVSTTASCNLFYSEHSHLPFHYCPS